LQRQERAAIGSADDLEEAKLSSNLGRMLTRRFKAGDVYAPHDLSGTEMLKWKQRKMPEHDVFDVLNFNPLDHYRVCLLVLPGMPPLSQKPKLTELTIHCRISQ